MATSKSEAEAVDPAAGVEVEEDFSIELAPPPSPAEGYPKHDDAGRLIVTGCDHAWVNTSAEGPGSVAQVYEGQPVPDNALDGEVERLGALGAFDEHPRQAHLRQVEAARIAGVPLVSGAIAGSAGQG